MKIICTKCKNEMADNDKFCPTCGFSKEEILGINTEVTNFEPMIEVYREWIGYNKLDSFFKELIK